MPVAPTGGSSNNGVAFLVAAAAIMEAVAAFCSSPQTTEINADKRAETLMKWVHIGMTTGVALVVIAAIMDRKHAPAILLGGGVTAGVMYGSYLHAKKSGLASCEPGTEDG